MNVEYINILTLVSFAFDCKMLILALIVCFARLDNVLCLKHLPKYFGTALNFFQSDHMDVAKAAAKYMKVNN